MIITGKGLTKICINLSELYLDCTEEITKGSSLLFYATPLHLEECLLKAFKNSVIAFELAKSDSQQLIRTMKSIIERLKKYFNQDLSESIISQLNKEESLGVGPYRFRCNFLFDSNGFNSYSDKRKALDESVRLYDNIDTNKTKDDLRKIRREVSKMARKLSEDTLEVSQKNIKCVNHQGKYDVENKITTLKEILELPLQFAMMAVHWENSRKSIEVLNSALEHLENAVDVIQELIDRTQTFS